MNDMTEAPNPSSLAAVSTPRPDQNLDLLSGLSIRVSVEVGSTTMRLSDLINTAEGSVIELDRATTDLLDLFANGTLIARGEIVSVDGRYGIRIVELASADAQFPYNERRQ